jgi:hypothetical protein
MAPSGDTLRLVEQPREALAVEVKDWLDVKILSHQAKIVKAVMALRNHNGGFLLIGFDKNMQPSKTGQPGDPTTVYTADMIQGLTSKYSSEAFEVTVEFPERDGVRYPVIKVAGGASNLVAAKTDLRDGGNTLICANDVYIRTLNSNNIASTSKPTWRDWPSIMQVFFDNRESDIGNFFRRHLGEVARERLVEVLRRGTLPSNEERAKSFLNKMSDRFGIVISARKLTVPDHGFWEVAMVINGDVPPHRLNGEFLRMLDAKNPRYTGWPVWMNSARFDDESERPYVEENAYEALIIADHGFSRHYDLMRLDPAGRFYLRRAYEDDVTGPPWGPGPFTQLDFALPVLRAAEVIAVGLIFAKALGCDPDKTSLSFVFAWHRLKGRALSSWSSPNRRWFPSAKADRDSATSYIEVPLDLPPSRLGSETKLALEPLFDVFDEEIGQDVADDLTTRLTTRTL